MTVQGDRRAGHCASLSSAWDLFFGLFSSCLDILECLFVGCAVFMFFFLLKMLFWIVFGWFVARVGYFWFCFPELLYIFLDWVLVFVACVLLLVCFCFPKL